MRRRKILFCILTVLWMGVIFCLSGRNASQSTEDSNGVGMIVGEVTQPQFEEWPAEKQQAYSASIDHPVRKAAHATEYLILFFLIYGTVAPLRLEIPVSWGIATLYACTDEFHQLFVPGRSGEVRDVMIDSSGALAGVLILLLFRGIAGRVRHRTESTDHAEDNHRKRKRRTE